MGFNHTASFIGYVLQVMAVEMTAVTIIDWYYAQQLVKTRHSLFSLQLHLVFLQCPE
jgi:hypothetical protein